MLLLSTAVLLVAALADSESCPEVYHIYCGVDSFGNKVLVRPLDRKRLEMAFFMTDSIHMAVRQYVENTSDPYMEIDSLNGGPRELIRYKGRLFLESTLGLFNIETGKCTQMSNDHLTVRAKLEKLYGGTCSIQVTKSWRHDIVFNSDATYGVRTRKDGFDNFVGHVIVRVSKESVLKDAHIKIYGWGLHLGITFDVSGSIPKVIHNDVMPVTCVFPSN